jgi:allantoin racemase
MHAAALLGRRFSLLVTTNFSARYFLEHVNRSGLGSRLASCQVVEMPPEDIGVDPSRTLELLVQAASEAIVAARADTLILGCTGFAPFGARLREKLAGNQLSVPVIDPFAVTINTLASLIGAGLTHSRLAYPDTGISKVWRVHPA